ncbi:hypothetical protein ACFVWX_23290 [Streptomyces sp. NPDC058220]|uniref:hypothetical protein n=1 Tax=Streptomyces sp. NPDC058220 TaxID=3346387 RepID=UPI0036DFBA4E
MRGTLLRGALRGAFVRGAGRPVSGALSALWRWAAGHAGPAPAPAGEDTGPEGSRTIARKPTSRFLRGRMLLLPVLGLMVLLPARTAYFDVHDRTESLRDRYTPALVYLADARTALRLAQDQAERRLGQPVEVGLGEEYRSLYTEASQSLNRAAQTGALDRGQEQELRVVSGLVVAYGDWIAWADRRSNPEILRRAGLRYAASMLNGAPGETTAVLQRIRGLERQLGQDAREAAAWSAVAVGAAVATALAAGLFAVVAAGTLVYLRFQLRLFSVLLALAVAPVLLALVPLAAGAVIEQGAQRQVGEVAVLIARAGEGAEGVTPAARGEIRNRAAEMAERIRRARPAGWSATAGVALSVGTAGALACGITLFLYGREYLVRGRYAEL